MPNHMSGKDVQTTYRQNNAPVTFNAQSVSVEENAEEVADQVNGEDRARHQIITDGFTITIKAYAGDLAVLDAHLADIANNDARVAPLNKALTFRFRKHDGTRAAYTATEVTRSPMQIEAGGRKERVMQTLKLRARYFKAVQAA